ncbi:MAG: hypothetical protein RL172_180 [Bacteroidota bacterium]|jgi:hypothetical protein
MQVLVFKTNLYNSHCVLDVKHCLDQHPQIQRWNVDLHDYDNILRIETAQLAGTEVEQLLQQAGYFCKELY